MDNGIVIEYAAPIELLVMHEEYSTIIDLQTTFAEMVLQTGDTNASEILEIARSGYKK